MAQTARQIARFHKWIGLVVGLQFLFWTASGLFFTLFPIEQIRGEHLRSEVTRTLFAPESLDVISPAQIMEQSDKAFSSLTLRVFLDEPVYEAVGEAGSVLFNARNGALLSPIGEETARAVALEAWAGDGELVSAEWITTPPREAFSSAPLWRLQFEGKDRATFWVDPQAGKVKAVRTGKWRIFDVLWRFHIMDVTGDDKFDTWWLKLFAGCALVTVLLGVALLAHRALRGRLFR